MKYTIHYLIDLIYLSILCLLFFFKVAETNSLIFHLLIIGYVFLKRTFATEQPLSKTVLNRILDGLSLASLLVLLYALYIHIPKEVLVDLTSDSLFVLSFWVFGVVTATGTLQKRDKGKE